MTPKTLRFRARGTALVQNHGRADNGIRAYVGWAWDAKHAGWAATGAAEEVPYLYEYVKACKDGDIWAADQETAQACGVQFDAAFGAPAAAEQLPLPSHPNPAPPPPAHDSEGPSELEAHDAHDVH